METGTERKSYTTKELAALCGVSPQSIRNWSDSGKIPPCEKTIGGHRRFSEAHVKALNALMGRIEATVQVETVSDFTNGF